MNFTALLHVLRDLPHVAAIHIDHGLQDEFALEVRRFKAFVADRIAPSCIAVEVPLHHELGDGRAALVDLLAETDAGWFIVDHKASP